MGLFSSIAKIAKSVVKNPIVKVAAGGLAIAFPPAGIPAAAAVAAAGKIADAATGKTGTPAQQASAKRVIANTVIAAKKGDPNAARAVVAIKKAQTAKALTAAMAPKTPPQKGWLVSPTGKIQRVG